MKAYATRRQFSRRMLETAAAASLLRLAFTSQAFASPVQPVTEAWAGRVSELARDYRLQALTATQWQDATEVLNRKIPLHELMSYIDFDRIAAGLQRQAQGEHNQTIWIPGLDWKTHRIWTAIFILPAGQAVPPHGHNGFVGAHLVLQGKMRARTFDRVIDEPGRMRLKPKIDAAFASGDTISMSNDRDNVHWFAAADGPVFTFDINVVSTEKRTYANPTERQGRIFLSPKAGLHGDGLIEAPVVNEQTCRSRFSTADSFMRF